MITECSLSFSDWREKTDPIMCSYKAVEVRLEIWGLQTRVEDFIHRVSFYVNLITQSSSVTTPLVSGYRKK